MLAWYPLEIILALLLILTVIFWLLGRGRSIWWKNISALLLLLAIAHFIFIPDIGPRLRHGYTSNSAETSANAQFPELYPPFIGHEPDVVYEAAVQTGERLNHFQIEDQDPQTHTLHLTYNAPTWQWWPGPTLFSGDLEVKITSFRFDSKLALNAVSDIRFGDWGESKRALLLFERMLLEGLN